MLPASNTFDGTNDSFCLGREEEWRISLALDLEERSVLEGEVLLARIAQRNAPGTASAVPAP
jgi:hypothetical protein